MSKFISAYHRHTFEPEPVQHRVEAILRETGTRAIPSISAARSTGRASTSRARSTFRTTFPAAAWRFARASCTSPSPTGGSRAAARRTAPTPILREDEDVLEAVSDPAGSRMLWYYFDDDQFVVSNSERAITLYTGRFDFEPAVVPWVVSTGTRGPGQSYNRHLRLLPPAGTARLDKAAWTLDVSGPPIRFAEVRRSREEHLAALEAALSETFAAFGEADTEHAILALSGGTDSRALAAFLGSTAGQALEQLQRRHARGRQDAGERRRHRRHGRGRPRVRATATSPPAPPPPRRSRPCLERFVIAGEGRHDHLNRLRRRLRLLSASCTRTAST